ncbi:MAG TPA: heme exporter protein CcmD [Sphingomonadales bacterium]|nr:heme exporter protein CcmD [Sphingomonadales bacterium]
MLILSGVLYGVYTAHVWSSYAIALGALLALAIVSFRRRHTLGKTLALLEPPAKKK